MAKRPTCACALCKQTKPLCKSHLLPHAITKCYEPSIRPSSAPLIVTSGGAVPSEYQVEEYLLCESCGSDF